MASKENSPKHIYWAKTIGLWALTILLALIFLQVGLGKLSFFREMWAERFVGWGLPATFALVIGVIEVVGALLLLIPKTASYGAASIIPVMLGASITHLLNAEFPNSGFTLIIAALVFVVGFARRPAYLRKQVTPAH